MGFEELIARASWEQAPSEFRAPHEHPATPPFVASELFPAVPAPAAPDWLRLRARWVGLTPHPNIIAAVSPARGSRGVLLRCPALDWSFAPVDATRHGPLAAWGAQIVRAFEHVTSEVPVAQRGRFARPSLHVDMGGHARLAFLPCTPSFGAEAWPPELAATWPHADERALVYLVGIAIAGLADDITRYADTPLGRLVARCGATDPSARPPSLAALHAALVAMGEGAGGMRRGVALDGWNLVEAGLGWLAIAQPGRALRAFEAALELGTPLALAMSGRAVARAQLGFTTDAWVPRPRGAHGRGVAAARHMGRRAASRAKLAAEPVVRFAAIADAAAQLEATRAFADALALYARAVAGPARDTAIARCYQHLGEPRWAADFASRALAAADTEREPRAIRLRARLRLKDPAAALVDADVLVAADETDGGAHYLRGRCYLGLGRNAEARDAFDRACQLSPQLLEAMFLRRTTVRAANETRARVGTPRPPELAIPAHLGEVRAALATGDVALALATLDAEAYLTDPDAQRVRGNLLLYANRPADALGAFARADGDEAARAGEARALLALDRPAEALAVFDELLAAGAGALDLAEGRAAALALLGRADDATRSADDALRAEVARAERRVQVAR